MTVLVSFPVAQKTYRFNPDQPLIYQKTGGGQLVGLMQEGKLWALDPRCLLVDAANGEVIYNPREHIGDGIQDKWVTDWLKKHPEWPDEKLGLQGS